MKVAALLVLMLTAVRAEEVKIGSSRDPETQLALFDVPEGAGPFPLLVHLHSWSANYKNSSELDVVRKEAARRKWVFLSPDFRGPNNRPDACGSELAVSDVVDAVRYAMGMSKVDLRRVYLVGGSGGGHMSLLMAGRYPEMWTAVSSWVPISDLAAWHASTKKAGLRYEKMLEQCTGGPPGPGTDAEYKRRSPLTWLARAKGVPISIHTGIHDGHGGGSVPVSHSLRAFNELAKVNGHAEAMFTEEQIREITETEKIPSPLALAKPEPEGKFSTLLRRKAGPVRLTIFEGGHATDFLAATEWLSGFVK